MNFFKNLICRDAFKSSIILALVVGTLLNLINQFDALVGLDFAGIEYGKFTLTFFVPFLVSMYASAITKTKMGE